MKRKQYKMEQKYNAVLKSRELGIEKTAKLLDISARTLNRWRKKYKDGGKDALKKGFNPRISPFNNIIPAETREAIIRVKKEEPSLSAPKINKKLNLSYSSTSIYKIIRDANLKQNRDILKKDISMRFNSLFFTIQSLRKVDPGETGEKLNLMQVIEPDTGFCFVGFAPERSFTKTIIFLKHTIQVLRQFNFTVSEILMSRYPQNILWEKELNQSLNVSCKPIIDKKTALKNKRQLKKLFTDFKFQTEKTTGLIFQTHNHILGFNLDILKELETLGYLNIPIMKDLFYTLPPIFIDDNLNIVPSLGKKKITVAGKNTYQLDYRKYLFNRAKETYLENKNESSIEYCNKALIVAQLLKGKEAASAEILLQKGLAYLKIGKPIDGKNCFNSSLKLATKIGNRERIAEAGYLSGYLYLTRGEADRALEYYQQAIKIYKKLKNNRKICIVSNLIINVYKKRNECEKALSLAVTNMKAAEELDDYILKSIAYNSIAGLYMRLEDYEKAKEYYNNNLALQKNKNDKNGMIVTYSNLGLLFFETKSYSQAIKYYNKQRDLARENGNLRQEAKSLFNIGTIQDKLWLDNNKKVRMELAIHNYLKAYETFIKLDDKNEMITVNEYLGKIYQENNNNRIAFRYFKNMLNLAEEVHNDFKVERAKSLIDAVY